MSMSQGWEARSLRLGRVQGAVLFVVAVVTILVHTPWLVTAISGDVQMLVETIELLTVATTYCNTKFRNEG